MLDILIEILISLFIPKYKRDSFYKSFNKYKNNLYQNNSFSSPKNNYVDANKIYDNSNNSVYSKDYSSTSEIYTENPTINTNPVVENLAVVTKPNTQSTGLNLNFNTTNLREGLIYSEVLAKPLSKRKRKVTTFGHNRFNR